MTEPIDVSPQPPMEEVYLGDGLYASFDGFQLKLRAPRDRDDHECYLEPQVFLALIEFIKRTPLSALLKQAAL